MKFEIGRHVICWENPRGDRHGIVTSVDERKSEYQVKFTHYLSPVMRCERDLSPDIVYDMCAEKGNPHA